MIFERLQQQLHEREQAHQYRRRRIMGSPQGIKVRIDDREYLNFCSNDYLGLANHPELKKSFRQAADRYGVGSGSAHLINGHSHEHHALEEELAAFTGRQRALLFSTGYMANLGVVASLLGRNDMLFEDRLNHASLIDAGILSRARMQRYAHNDMAVLDEKLAQCDKGEKLIVSDGVFSMDGDQAPIADMARLACEHDALLMIDDAHGFGALGKTGGGSLEQLGLDTKTVPVLMGTLGKALGTFGAFVAGDEILIEALINHARSYVYTTALPPAVAAATRTSLRLLQSESWRREKLAALVDYWKQGAAQLQLPLMPSDTAIQPLLLGSSEKTIRISQQLDNEGFLISAIRPPTVANGQARLRITFCAEHEQAHIDRLLEALEGLFKKELKRESDDA
ncbi:8-amino-7-oxononanoate synthase [hydrothermal vent metagenome]|uniref:8-amino-7-oxononanoate synthase n=1 Tax=hydrothermal vent metagenome TaxID=652676 RepID=A0A3B1C0V9_9ZZZZ